MNYLGIIEKIKELEITPDMLADIWGKDKEKLIKELGEFDVVHEQEDCEGGGDYSEKVFYFKEHNVYVQITGFYASYDGTTWNEDFNQVEPKQKTITVYE